MKFSLLNIASVAFFSLSISPAGYAQPLDEPAYCPSTTTDTNSDGWGTENGRPCRVLGNVNSHPVCIDTTLTTDSDLDGWGWRSGATCLVDNTTVEKNFKITESDGTITIGENAGPLVESYVKSFGHFATAMQISSDSTLYHYRLPNQLLAASDSNGSTLWELKLNNGFITELILNESEDTLYGLTRPDGRVAAFSTEGLLNWRSEPIGNHRRIDLTRNAIIVGVADDDTDPFSPLMTSVVSLNLDGSLRWKFEPGGNISRLEIGRDNRIYVKYVSPPYANETTFILEE